MKRFTLFYISKLQSMQSKTKTPRCFNSKDIKHTYYTTLRSLTVQWNIYSKTSNAYNLKLKSLIVENSRTNDQTEL